MIVLDENLIENQCQLLKKWRIRFQQIGFHIGRPGMKDEEIISLLHGLSQATFFTRDDDFFDKDLCHPNYCLVFLAVKKDEAASFIKRFLRNHNFASKSKRMGKVVRVAHAVISFYEKGQDEKEVADWT